MTPSIPKPEPEPVTQQTQQTHQNPKNITPATAAPMPPAGTAGDDAAAPETRWCRRCRAEMPVAHCQDPGAAHGRIPGTRTVKREDAGIGDDAVDCQPVGGVEPGSGIAGGPGGGNAPSNT